MLRFVTLLVLLALTWTQQASSTMYADKPFSEGYGEFVSVLKKAEFAVKKILHSDEHKKILSSISDKMKSKLSKLNLDAKVFSEIIKVVKDILQKVEDGSLNEEKIIQFLKNDPYKQFDSLLKKLQKTKTN